jgi:hypothetical protein
VRKAGSLRVRESLGPWLHAVAYRVASGARVAVARRRRHERKAAERAAQVHEEPVRGEWESTLHDEIRRLPERYRIPVVLCDLEGLTSAQATERLQWSVETVRSRWARGRERLRARLAHRGLALSVTALAALAPRSVPASVSAALARATFQAATRFATGTATAGTVPTAAESLAIATLSTMTVAPVPPMAIAVVTVLALAGGARWLLVRADYRQPAPAQAASALVVAAVDPKSQAPKVGDQILTQNTKTGALDYQPVIAVYHNKPTSTLRLDLGTESIVATLIHRFWKAGHGWVMARDLKADDALRALGGIATIKAISQEKVQPVFNLEVAQNRSFFVGQGGMLVHDNSLVEATPEPFDAAPALAAAKAEQPAP